ncbi:FIST signal transduction protein [Ferruginibacter sp. SUN106]|uniref:FIST signal transduction protein n=1 Tax=Ferruginibacter sp. SUN106 TaxID=2978348 RepID=UPI003D36CB32
MKAKSIKGNSTAEINNALQQSMADGFKPTLTIIFISIKQDSSAVCEILTVAEIDCIGATSCNEFTDGHQTEGAIAILLLEVDRNNYSMLTEDIGTKTIAEAATQLSNAALEKFSKPSLILLSTSLMENGAILDGETLIRNIERSIGSQVNMFGGMAGDDMSFTGPYIFSNNWKTTYGVAAIVFNAEKIKMYGVALSGWRSIGVSRTITKSKNNLLYEIDGKPALEMYLRFLGADYDATHDRSKFFDGVGLHYPLQIERKDREPMMCNPMGYDKEENALILESNIEEGSHFKFSTPPDFDIVATVVDKAKEIRNAHDTDADAVLIFSCASRLSALGPMAQQENDGLAEIWNAPMAGFYTYGEFGRAVNGKHEFHSTTCSWVALKEE